MKQQTIPYNCPTLRKNDLQAVLECMISDELAPGEEVTQFEQLITTENKAFAALALNSEVAAFHLAFIALDSQPDEEWIISANQSPKILNAIRLMRGKPILVDLDPDSLHPSIASIKEKMGSNTKGIILSHDFGLPVSLAQYAELGLPIIENGLEAFSQIFLKQQTEVLDEQKRHKDFYPDTPLLRIIGLGKNRFLTTGQGSVLIFQKENHYERVKGLVDEFQVPPPKNYFEYRMPNILASLGIQQWKQLKKVIAKRTEMKQYYLNQIQQWSVGKQYEKLLRRGCGSAMLINTPGSAQEAIQAAAMMHIEVHRGVDAPLHHILEEPRMAYPIVEHLYGKTISLPIYPTLIKSQVDFLLKGIQEIISQA